MPVKRGNPKYRFDNFKLVAGTKEAYRIFKAYAEGEVKQPLLLCWGMVGSGKTHLIEALALRMRERGIYVRVAVMQDFLRTLKGKIRDKEASPSYDEVMENYCRAKILLLDDVGMGMMDSKWESAVLEELVDYRYRNELPTVMTTNKDIKEFPERVLSRFCDREVSNIVRNEGRDYRRRAKDGLPNR